jgi:hypothetical protein
MIPGGCPGQAHLKQKAYGRYSRAGGNPGGVGVVKKKCVLLKNVRQRNARYERLSLRNDFPAWIPACAGITIPFVLEHFRQGEVLCDCLALYSR